tara:strand:- start:590 stop:823 length:234 start_codon:yes stop_codon:yes gene_type:complete
MDHTFTHISVFEPNDKNAGAEVSYSTHSSRKSFHLPKPADSKYAKPLAIESFATDPQIYHEWMSEIDRYLRKQKSLK